MCSELRLHPEDVGLAGDPSQSDLARILHDLTEHRTATLSVLRKVEERERLLKCFVSQGEPQMGAPRAKKDKEVDLRDLLATLSSSSAAVKELLVQWAATTRTLCKNEAPSAFFWRGQNYEQKLEKDNVQVQDLAQTWGLIEPAALSVAVACDPQTAATAIQSVFRGHKTRMWYQYSVIKRQNAETIQRFYRRVLKRRSIQNEARLVSLTLKLQAFWRGAIARKRVMLYRQQYVAARKIQCAWRSHHTARIYALAMEELRVQKSAVALIQRTGRGFLERFSSGRYRTQCCSAVQEIEFWYWRCREAKRHASTPKEATVPRSIPTTEQATRHHPSGQMSTQPTSQIHVPPTEMPHAVPPEAHPQAIEVVVPKKKILAERAPLTYPIRCRRAYFDNGGLVCDEVETRAHKEFWFGDREAATRIQRAWLIHRCRRRYVALRQRVLQYQRERVNYERREDASKVVSAYCCFAVAVRTAKATCDRQQGAVVRMQRQWRFRSTLPTAHAHEDDIYCSQFSYEEMCRRKEAALKLASWGSEALRAKSRRRLQRRRERAAVRIQSVWRGMLARLAYQERLSENRRRVQEAKEKQQAAIQAQRRVEALLTQFEHSWWKVQYASTAERIERHVERVRIEGQSPTVLRRQARMVAAEKIQRVWRQWHARCARASLAIRCRAAKDNKLETELQNCSAVTVQKVFRGYQSRLKCLPAAEAKAIRAKYLETQRWIAAVKIQRCVRGWLARCAALRLRVVSTSMFQELLKL